MTCFIDYPKMSDKIKHNKHMKVPDKKFYNETKLFSFAQTRTYQRAS